VANTPGEKLRPFWRRSEDRCESKGLNLRPEDPDLLLELGVLGGQEFGVFSELFGTERLGVLNLLPSNELGEWISDREI
jgi:hypothetical protein